MMDPDFDAREGSDALMHIVADDGTYQYDAIGNLIKDQDEGVLITWTPYGKVREVHTKGDSLVVAFRYDATGNRISKRFTLRNDTTHYTTSITRYLRDAGGNVMAIYKDSLLIEQPIYGSSRLGQYKGTTVNGSLTLGERRYELNNHLGNVLAVITDNINMQADSAWANVVSTADYYPFGLEMKGRVYTDTTNMYRYGFNGKEKDGNFGDLVYDYGFRIYNPRIGKFLSVDPLIQSYPWYTPYQFAGNKPIWAIDLDGLEELIINKNITKFPGSDMAIKIFNDNPVIKADLKILSQTKFDIHIIASTAAVSITLACYVTTKEEIDQELENYGIDVDKAPIYSSIEKGSPVILIFIPNRYFETDFNQSPAIATWDYNTNIAGYVNIIEKYKIDVANAADLSFEFAHEVDAHAIPIATDKPLSINKSHGKFYGDKKYEDYFSPDYSKIDPNGTSPASKIKKGIEQTEKKLLDKL